MTFLYNTVLAENSDDILRILNVSEETQRLSKFRITVHEDLEYLWDILTAGYILEKKHSLQGQNFFEYTIKTESSRQPGYAALLTQPQVEQDLLTGTISSLNTANISLSPKKVEVLQNGEWVEACKVKASEMQIAEEAIRYSGSKTLKGMLHCQSYQATKTYFTENYRNLSRHSNIFKHILSFFVSSKTMDKYFGRPPNLQLAETLLTERKRIAEAQEAAAAIQPQPAQEDLTVASNNINSNLYPNPQLQQQDDRNPAYLGTSHVFDNTSFLQESNQLPPPQYYQLVPAGNNHSPYNPALFQIIPVKQPFNHVDNDGPTPPSTPPPQESRFINYNQTFTQ